MAVSCVTHFWIREPGSYPGGNSSEESWVSELGRRKNITWNQVGKWDWKHDSFLYSHVALAFFWNKHLAARPTIPSRGKSLSRGTACLLYYIAERWGEPLLEVSTHIRCVVNKDDFLRYSWFACKNKDSLLALMVPWKALNIHGNSTKDSL